LNALSKMLELYGYLTKNGSSEPQAIVSTLGSSGAILISPNLLQNTQNNVSMQDHPLNLQIKPYLSRSSLSLSQHLVQYQLNHKSTIDIHVIR